MKRWWRRAAWPERVMALASALVVTPGFVWATVTWQTGWVAWLWAVAMAWVLLWTFLTVRRYRRGRRTGR